MPSASTSRPGSASSRPRPRGFRTPPRSSRRSAAGGGTANRKTECQQHQGTIESYPRSRPTMKKRILFVVIGLVILIGALSAVKALQIRAMIAQAANAVPPPETVTTAAARAESWEATLTAVGSLTAVQGVTVAAELPGKVVHIAFEPGAKVERGDLLIRQDTSAEDGQLLREGDPIVTLQSLDPIFVDFTLPQQELARLRPGLPVRVTCDCLPGPAIQGRITAVNPLVDAETRSVRLQATVANRAEKLRPGMFVSVAVGLPDRQKVLAIPATAVLYAPYGDSVFVVVEDKEGKGCKAVRQQFVRLGEKRGDFVAVTH